MDIGEFFDLREKLLQFEKEHGLELSIEEALTLNCMRSMIAEYIIGLEE